MLPRQVTTIILSMLALAAAVLATQQTIANRGVAFESAAVIFSSLIVLSLVLFFHLRGWRYSPEATVAILTVLTIAGASPATLANTVVISLLIPVVVAAILLRAEWPPIIFGVVLLVVFINALLAHGGFNPARLGPTFSFINLTLLTVIVFGVTLASGLARRAQHEAEAQARRAEAALGQVADQSRALEQQVATTQAALVEAERARSAAAEQLRTVQEQRELIQRMSVPILPIADQALLMPLVGALDSARLRLALEAALEALESQRARYVLLDITGVPVIDTMVARGLIQLITAAKLLGAEVLIVGVRPEVAQTVVSLGVPLDELQTRSTLQAGIAHVLRLLGGGSRPVAV